MAEDAHSPELLLVLSGLKLLAESGEEWAHSTDIASALKDGQIADVHWRRIQSLLDSKRELVARRKRNHRWQYCLLEAGKASLGENNDSVVLVDPSKALQSTIAFHEILTSLGGHIKVCDPYIDASSIEHLDALPSGSQVQYLSFHVKNEGILRRTISAFSATGRSMEVGLLAKAEIHDRYIIDSKQLIILGSSLNGFGRKQSFIIRAGQDMRRVMLRHFKSCWQRATLW